jgi:hypothetical protein
MRRRHTLAALALTAAALIAAQSAATASSVHLKGGSAAEPAFTDRGVTLQAAGAIAGLGLGDVAVSLTAVGQPTADCVNPGTGEHRPPGHNPAQVTLTGVQRIPASAVKNGNVAFDVTTAAPRSPIAGAPDCPNTLWVENITDVAFVSGSVTVEQPAGALVLTVGCLLAPPTADGPVPAGDVTCASS